MVVRVATFVCLFIWLYGKDGGVVVVVVVVFVVVVVVVVWWWR